MVVFRQIAEWLFICLIVTIGQSQIVSAETLEEFFFTHVEMVDKYNRNDSTVLLVDFYSGNYFSGAEGYIETNLGDKNFLGGEDLEYESAGEAYRAGKQIFPTYIMTKTHVGFRIYDHYFGVKRAEYELNFNGQVQNYRNFESGEFCGLASGISVEIKTCYDENGQLGEVTKSYYNAEDMLIKRVVFDSSNDVIKRFEYKYKDSYVHFKEYDAEDALVFEYQQRLGVFK